MLLTILLLASSLSPTGHYTAGGYNVTVSGEVVYWWDGPQLEHVGRLKPLCPWEWTEQYYDAQHPWKDAPFRGYGRWRIDPVTGSIRAWGFDFVRCP